MKNVFLALIVRFALHFITVLNRKLHIAAFRELLRLVPNFLLPPSNDFQLNLPSFCDSLLNPYKVIVTLLLVLKSPMVLYALNLSYYTLAEMAEIDKTIAIAMSEFVIKAIDNEKEYLRPHSVNLIDNIELLQF